MYLLYTLTNKFTFIGTGGEAGIPIHACDCDMCRQARENQKYVRRPPTNILSYKGKNYFIDMGFPIILTDLKFNQIPIDGIFLTHTHIAHTQGLFYLKWTRQQTLPVYFAEGSELVDGFDKLLLSPSFLGPFKELKPLKTYKMDEIEVTPVPLNHTVMTVGYYIEADDFNLAFLSDTKGLPEQTENFLKGKEIDIVIVDAMYPSKWDIRDHNNLDEAINLLEKLDFYKAFLTHISHMYGSNEALNQQVEKKSATLKGEVLIAFDYMYVELKSPFKTGFLY